MRRLALLVVAAAACAHGQPQMQTAAAVPARYQFYDAETGLLAGYRFQADDV